MRPDDLVKMCIRSLLELVERSGGYITLPLRFKEEPAPDASREKGRGKIIPIQF